MDSVPGFLKKSAKRIAQEGVDAMFKGKKVCAYKNMESNSIPIENYTSFCF